MTTKDNQSAKQGAAIGGWVCFIMGAVIMYYSVWTFILYVPLFIASFVLSIAAMAQRRIVPGIMLLLATLVIPPIQWFALSATRMGQFMKDHPVPNRSASPAPSIDRPQTNALTSTRERTDSSPTNTRAIGPPEQKPADSEQASIEKILADSLLDLHASEITITNTRLLAKNVLYNPHPVFSMDGETVTYSQGQGQSVSIIVARLRDHKTLATWTPPVPPTALAWSPDGNRLAYKTKDEGLHIVDWTTKKDIAVPMTYQFGNQYGPLAWLSVNELLCSGGEFLIHTLDLNSLKVVGTEFRNLGGARSALGLSSKHRYCQIFQDTSGYTKGPLFVGDKDSSYSRVILSRFDAPYYVSADIRHVLVFGNPSGPFNLFSESLTHHILGKRESPEMAFRINLNELKLSRDKLAEFNKYLDKGTPFRGKVYAALTNPLNDTVVGPNTSLPKGTVRAIKWRDHRATVAIETELCPIQAGDIVANIRTDGDGYGHWFESQNEWVILQQLSDNAGKGAADKSKKAEDQREAVEDPNGSNTRSAAPIIESSSERQASRNSAENTNNTGPPASRNENGWIQLCNAASNGDEDEVGSLLAAGADPNLSDDNGSTPLHLAVVNGHDAVVSVLLEAGAAPDPVDRLGRTPLMAAAGLGHTIIIKWLLEKGAQIDARDTNAGFSPLQHAVASTQLKAVKLLLQRGANVEVRDNGNNTPLLDALIRHFEQKTGTEIIRVLVEHDANVNVTKEGASLLHLAALGGDCEIAKLLIAKGANINQRGPNGITPLDVARIKGHMPVVRLLESKGAK